MLDRDYSHLVGLIGNDALVRATPAVDGEVLMQLVEGAALRLTGLAEQHQGLSWYPVSLPRITAAPRSGWIRADQLTVPSSPCREWGPAKLEALGADHLWGSYTFALADEHAYPAKCANITIAARNIDGMAIAPDAEAGINSRWVRRKHGDFFTGWCESGPCRAGGICGAATTFFRALLRSGLPIVEARSHGAFYDSYNYPGADAMIYAPGSDLRFENDTGGVLVVVAWAEVQASPAALLTHFAIFGTRPRLRQVQLGEPVYDPVHRRYELSRLVIRTAGDEPFAGQTTGSISVEAVEGNAERWSFTTTYGGVAWWEALARDEQQSLFDLDD